MALDIEKIKKMEEEYRNSERYKKDLAHISHLEKIRERNINYLYNLSVDERYALIRKIYDKYESQEYRDKEKKLGYYIPRESLYDIILDYAVMYGKPSSYNTNQDEEDYYFSEEQYDIDGKFVIGVIYGQGSIIYLCPIDDDEVIPHIINETEVTVYDKNNKKVIKTKDKNVFDDICLQIATKHLEGFYIIFNNKQYPILKNGYLEKWPDGLFDKELKTLAQIIKQRKK